MTRWYDETFEDNIRFGLRVQRMLHSERSPFQHIEIFESAAYGRVLALDGILMTSERDEHFYHEMLVHPALTTAADIRRVLIIGGGDGGTAREVLRYPEVEQVVMVEIDRRVVELCREHLPSIGTAWDDTRLELRFQDGVAYVRESGAGLFDVVLVDGSDPVGPAKGLFSEEFYRGCRRLAGAGGVCAVQSESPFLTPRLFDDVVGTLRNVFGRALPYFGPAPLYSAGLWSWTHASDSADPMAIRDTRAEHVEQHTRYYNREIHRAAFALPNILRRGHSPF